ncbi:MAG: hypothetical protein ACYS47_20410 [Planctomycetota bacterium]|jgi:tetratricopeptide (TPR) repeat protein
MHLEPVPRRWSALIITFVVFAAVSTVCRGADLEEKLQAHLVGSTDFPPGWGLLGRTVDTDQSDFILQTLDARKKERNDFLFRMQGIKGGSTNFNVIVFVFEDDRMIESLAKSFDPVRENWDITCLAVTTALYVIHPANEDAKRVMARILGLQRSRPHLEEAESQLEKGNEEDAARALLRIEKDFKECGAACAWAGELYARRFSPPRIDYALRLFQFAVDAHEKTPLPPYTIWFAHAETAALLEVRKEFGKALLSWRRGAKCSAKAGLRLHSRTLYGLARMEARQGEPAAAEAALVEALAIAARFGDSELASRIRNEELLVPIVGREGLKGHLESAASVKCPEVFINPSAKKVALNKVKVLVLPPDVLEGEAHSTAGEAQLETGLERKFRKKCGVFKDRRAALASKLGAEFTSKICRQAEDAVKEDGCFDLHRFRGNRHGAPAALNEAYTHARKAGVIKFRPQFLLAVSLEIDTGAGSLGGRTGTLRAFLYEPKGMRVAAFLLYSLELPKGDPKGLLLRLGSEIYRKMDSCLRSGKWK